MENVRTDEAVMEDVVPRSEYQQTVRRYWYHKGGHIHYKNLYLTGKKYKLAAAVLALALVVLGFINLNLLFNVAELETNNAHLRQEFAELSYSLKSNDSTVSETVEQPATVQVQHPGAILRFDELVLIDTDYARSILFKEYRFSNIVEFQLLLENTGTDPLEPAVFLELFNHLGEPISSIKLKFNSTNQIPKLLEPGVPMSVSGVFDRPAGQQVAFFNLRAE